jgi:saccharopine dehydrogenase (NAD+, L-lysine-forming)
MAHLWLRAETKQFERRTPLTPEHVNELIKAGHKVTVEKWDDRIFPDSDYAAIKGVEMVEKGTWPKAPEDAYILGIKALPKNKPLTHKHIYFAHSYKDQAAAPGVLMQHERGKGTVRDLEYLTDPAGKRVAAFGRSAGLGGAAMALYTWCQKQLDDVPPMPLYYKNDAVMIKTLSDLLDQAINKVGHAPEVLVIGAKGRSGSGAADLFKAFTDRGVKVTEWGRKETEAGGPFPDILDKFDIMCNCIFNNGEIKPFLTKELVTNHVGPIRLSVIADVTNDIGPGNPIFGIEQSTTMEKPSIKIGGIDVIEVDILPAHVPMQSSIDFSEQLFPHLRDLLNGKDPTGVWDRALVKFVAHSDIPSAAFEFGKELARVEWKGDVNVLKDEIVRFLQKNPLTTVEQENFKTYLLKGLTNAGKSKRKVLALEEDLDIAALYNTPEMQRQHALLQAVYDFKNETFRTTLASNKSEKRFYEFCDTASRAIDMPNLKNKVTAAEQKFLDCLPKSSRKDPDIINGLASIKHKAGVENGKS